MAAKIRVNEVCIFSNKTVGRPALQMGKAFAAWVRRCFIPQKEKGKAASILLLRIEPV